MDTNAQQQCSANRYALPELQRLALKKQGLQSGVQCSTILSSARYAYANTPANDSKLRAHYLALIIRSRNTFKRSGTMQMEMERGGTPLFFDLFVAMVNHLVSHPKELLLSSSVADTIDVVGRCHQRSLKVLNILSDGISKRVCPCISYLIVPIIITSAAWTAYDTRFYFEQGVIRGYLVHPHV